MTHGPLDGVRVLDLSIAPPGPTRRRCSPTRAPRSSRSSGRASATSRRWVGVGGQRHERAVPRVQPRQALDRGRPAAPTGLDIVRRLAADADVLDPELPARRGRPARRSATTTCARSTPTSCTCRSRASAPTGPYRDRSAYDTVIQAYGGFAANQADPDDGMPVFLRQTAADKVTALYAAQAITAALFARERGEAASTSSCRCSTPWSRSCGPTRPATRCCWMPTGRSPRASSPASGRCGSPTAGASSRRRPTPTSPGCAGRSASTATTTRASRRSASACTNREFMAEIMERCYAHAGDSHAWPRRRARFEAERVPFAMILAPAELPERPARDGGRDCSRSTTITSSGRCACPAIPRSSVARPAASTGNSPALGEHTDEILAELGLGDADRATCTRRGRRRLIRGVASGAERRLKERRGVMLPMASRGCGR